MIKISRILINKIYLIFKYIIYNLINYINEIIKIILVNLYFIILIKLINYYSLFIYNLEEFKNLLKIYYLNNFIINYFLIIKRLKDL